MSDEFGAIWQGPPEPSYGHEPPPFVFPFSEVRALLRSYEVLLDELDALVAVHDGGLERCFPGDGQGFQGVRARRFLEAVVDQLRLTELERGDLAGAIDELRLVLQQATEARETRSVERRAYARAVVRFQQELAAYRSDPYASGGPSRLGEREP